MTDDPHDIIEMQSAEITFLHNREVYLTNLAMNYLDRARRAEARVAELEAMAAVADILPEGPQIVR